MTSRRRAVSAPVPTARLRSANDPSAAPPLWAVRPPHRPLRSLVRATPPPLSGRAWPGPDVPLPPPPSFGRLPVTTPPRWLAARLVDLALVAAVPAALAVILAVVIAVVRPAVVDRSPAVTLGGVAGLLLGVAVMYAAVLRTPRRRTLGQRLLALPAGSRRGGQHSLPAPTTRATAATALHGRSQPRRTRLMAVLVLTATAATATGALTACQGPDSPKPRDAASSGGPATTAPTTAPTSAAAAAPTADFTSIGDACTLPVPATLEHLTPGAASEPEQASDRWSCSRFSSSQDEQGRRLHRDVRIDISVATATSQSATDVTRRAFEANQTDARASWGPRYQPLLQVGDDGYSGYSVIGDSGQGKASIRLRNLTLDVTFSGDEWPPPTAQPSVRPLAEAAARGGAVELVREIASALARCTPCLAPRTSGPSSPASPSPLGPDSTDEPDPDVEITPI
ncbi:hypothetical protein ACGFNU_44250 [Spirillospora sp. NPDC048911]|uniref:hypothetical protein n=1 Tax=Spirillospora sp. NPDC048911 TaxID=3364527 RepID=UPI00371737DF